MDQVLGVRQVQGFAGPPALPAPALRGSASEASGVVEAAAGVRARDGGPGRAQEGRQAKEDEEEGEKGRDTEQENGGRNTKGGERAERGEEDGGWLLALLAAAVSEKLSFADAANKPAFPETPMFTPISAEVGKT